jgi:tetratricopeptide (TPR) repeat protein
VPDRAIIVAVRYRYEDLGDEEFQQLVQALLAHRLGLGMRAMPLGQADGGRDALHGTAVYQVKFAADPGRVRNPVAWLLSSLDRESDKIARLVARGATDYYLVTNVGGTGRLDAGSIDRLDRELKRRQRIWSVSIVPWWRETVDAQMSAAPDDLVRAFVRVLPPDQVLALAHLDRCGTRRLVQVGVVPPRAPGFQARAEAGEMGGGPSTGAADVLAPVGSLVLAGLGGVGKTQIAADYVDCRVQRGDLDLLVWVSASSRDAVISAYAEAAALVTEFPAPGSAEQGAARLLAWLATAGRRWLIVLDDLRAPAVLTGIWPPSTPAGRTIVTTRRTDAALAGDVRRIVEVGVFTKTAAATFLRERLAACPSAADDVDGLADDLGRLPLALSHAAAFMVDGGMTCGEYRRAFASRKHRLADLFPEGEALPDQGERTVDVTWSLSIDAANDLTPAGLARPLLELASMLDPNGIPAALFTAPAVLNWLTYIRAENSEWQELGPVQVRQGLHCLRRLSLASVGTDVVRVHRLVQYATREGLGREGIDDLLWVAADALFDIWPAIESDPGLIQLLRANARALAQHQPDALWKPQRHLLIFRHADSMADTGNLNDAIATYEQVLARSAQFLGPEDPDTFKARHELARLRGKAGNPALAADQLRKLAAEQTRVLGHDHPDMFVTRMNACFWQKNSDESADITEELEHLHADASRALGTDDPITLKIRGNLLIARADAGKSAESVDDLEEFIAAQTAIIGEHHPDTLATRANLVVIRSTDNVDSRAITDLEQLLADCEQACGPEHPDTLQIRLMIAVHRCVSGEPARAAKELEKLIAEEIKIFGSEHLAVQRSKKILCAAYNMLGNHRRAACVGHELLYELLQKRPPDDTEVFEARLNIAIARGSTGDPASAVADLEAILSDQMRAIGPSHPLTLTCRRVIAAMRCNGGNPAVAADELAQLLDNHIQILGPGHSEILATRWEIARARAKGGHPQQAVAAYESLLLDLKRVKGSCHPETLHARQELALWLARSGQAPQAIGVLQELLPDQIRVHGVSHPETLRTRQSLANRRAEAGDADRSRAELEQLLADQVRVLGPSHRETLMTRSNLADKQIDSGDSADAVTVYEQLHHHFRRALGSDDEDTLIIEAKLAVRRGQAGDLAGATNGLRNAIPKLRRVLGADHRWTLSARSSLAAFRASLGNLDEARHELERVLADQERVLGASDPETTNTSRNLANINTACILTSESPSFLLK